MWTLQYACREKLATETTSSVGEPSNMSAEKTTPQGADRYLGGPFQQKKHAKYTQMEGLAFGTNHAPVHCVVRLNSLTLETLQHGKAFEPNTLNGSTYVMHPGNTHKRHTNTGRASRRRAASSAFLDMSQMTWTQTVGLCALWGNANSGHFASSKRCIAEVFYRRSMGSPR